MSRWKVAQHIHYRTWLAYPAHYDSNQPHNDVDDDKPRTPRARAFRTWREAQDYADRQARTRPVVLWPTAAPLALEDDTRAQLCAEYIGSGETLRWVNIYNRFAGTQQPIDVLDCLPLARWLLKVHYTLMQEGVIPATD